MTFEEFIAEWADSKSFVRVKTSGSTGRPKEIFLSKNFMTQSASRTNKFFNITSGSNLYSCVSPDFIGGKMMAVRAMIAEANLMWENPSNRPLDNLNKNVTIDLLAVVPSQMIYLLENKTDLPEIRNIIIGGSAIHPDLKDKIVSSGFNAYETYGMTETASHIALRRISIDNEPFHTLPGIKIETDIRNTLKINFETGEEILTNDIAEVISESEFYIRGRIDDIIISGGKKINPIEVERKISHLIKRDYCIIGCADEKWGEKILLLVEGEINDSESSELHDSLKEALESWEVPKEIIGVISLPRTATGKIIRSPGHLFDF